MFIYIYIYLIYMFYIYIYTSGERRVQLFVEEPLLPVLWLLSDIAPFRRRGAQQGTEQERLYTRPQKHNTVSGSRLWRGELVDLNSKPLNY